MVITPSIYKTKTTKKHPAEQFISGFRTQLSLRIKTHLFKFQHGQLSATRLQELITKHCKNYIALISKVDCFPEQTLADFYREIFGNVPDIRAKLTEMILDMETRFAEANKGFRENRLMLDEYRTEILAAIQTIQRILL